MIYNNSYFNKELKEVYITNTISKHQRYVLGFLLALVAVGAHLTIITLSDTIFLDSFPYIMATSAFSILYMFNIVSIPFFVIYGIFYFKTLSFIEVNSNKWYTLIKMQFNPYKLVASKLFARFYYVFFVYTLGFITAVLISAILKYPIIIHYLFSLYLSGFLAVLSLFFICLACSIFVKKGSSNIWILILTILVFEMIKELTSYNKLTQDKILMKNVSNLFLGFDSTFTYICIASVIISSIVCYIAVPKRAIKYTCSNHIEGIEFMKKHNATKHFAVKTKFVSSAKAVNIVLTSTMVVIMIFMITLNCALFLFALSSFDDLDYGSKMPMMFSSDTMEPTINKNDLSFYTKIDPSYKLNVGDIIFFEVYNKEYVHQITEINDDSTLTVDITNYPAGAQEDYFLKTIPRDSVVGLNYSNNRWLGAFIVFVNSTIGRIILLLLPIATLYNRDKISAYIAGIAERNNE